VSAAAVLLSQKGFINIEANEAGAGSAAFKLENDSGNVAPDFIASWPALGGRPDDSPMALELTLAASVDRECTIKNIGR